MFNDLIRVADVDILFHGRSRRPPLDPVNALLSFLYTLLVHDCRSAAESVGLDPAVGFAPDFGVEVEFLPTRLHRL
ncbi:MAG TPA: CRISPR-associated endonuclease Cas1 [Roseiarcus sp.]|nr:CRISPR-associated endonuclease Cas1 [Roseiarcus sp.]